MLVAALLASPVPNAPAAHPYDEWSAPIKNGTCKDSSDPTKVQCTVQADGVKAYRFPAGIFEIDEQLLVPEKTSITGAASPNDMDNPTTSPDWSKQTLFLATKGVTEYWTNYCHASDMVHTRVGFVLSSHTTVRDVSYQGIDTIRPADNGALCGGGVFETKGCAENDCHTQVNNGGSDGQGSANVTIDNVRINDYHYAEDRKLVGADIEGNHDCNGADTRDGCCFCEPNKVRSAQVAVWVPQTRDAPGTRGLVVRDLVSRSQQADGVNLHGYVRDALVQHVHIENTGDDTFALWGGNLFPENVTFSQCTAVNPGVLRPNWYGNCVATYGLKSVVFDRITCAEPTLAHPIPQPYGSRDVTQIDTSMFVVYTSFGGQYAPGNSVRILDWAFTDLEGRPYTADNGTMADPKLTGKKAWTADDRGTVAPFFLPGKTQQVNVHVGPAAAATAVEEA